ncbi:hypothetical protein CISIN_1g044160mg [Citrus sinensis]|uniref:Uncharacterized protein n=1 Tax=Citrus sinensis TaxID=2711 RepID=A0A067D3M1_CITSI|nr:hypothetical protein CISIN_1g044160mg [Citrus sinensis]
MANGEQEPIDIECLANSLRKKFKTLHHLPEKCCIYRVPQQVRSLNPKAHAPQLVSIGPLHHRNNEELKAMEEQNLRYLEYFLQRTEWMLCFSLSSYSDIAALDRLPSVTPFSQNQRWYPTCGLTFGS